MLETIINWLILYQELAPYAVFVLLLLTGCSVPISEDVLVIASGVIAGSTLPEQTLALFMAAFLGSFFSDLIAYSIGRYISHRATTYGHWLGVTLSPDWTASFRRYFERWGLWTLIIGRMIPFGFRNGIFMTAGAGRMPLFRFLISDGISCLLFSSIVFWLSVHAAATGGASVESWLSQTGLIVFLIVSCGASYFLLRSAKSKSTTA